VRYQYVKQLGDDIGADLDIAMIESPDLTSRIVSAYPHLHKIEEMGPKDFQMELAATRMQNAFMKKRARKRIEEQKKDLKEQVCKIRGINPRKDRNGKVRFPEDVERESVAELMVEWRASQGGDLRYSLDAPEAQI